MQRYDPESVDGTLFLVDGDERVKVGAIEDVVDAMGGDMYVIEYDEKQRTQPWLETDDGKLDVDVHETMTSLPFTAEQVSELRKYDMETDRYGLPTRTYEYANMLIDILDQRGDG